MTKSGGHIHTQKQCLNVYKQIISRSTRFQLKSILSKSIFVIEVPNTSRTYDMIHYSIIGQDSRIKRQLYIDVITTTTMNPFKIKTK